MARSSLRMKVAAGVVWGFGGPKARELMRRATDSDVSNRGFPYLTAQCLAIGAVPVLALRISYAGELGWELYAPFESGQALWDELCAGWPALRRDCRWTGSF